MSGAVGIVLRALAGVVGAVLAIWGVALFAGDAGEIRPEVYYALAAVLVAVGGGLIVVAFLGGPRRHG